MLFSRHQLTWSHHGLLAGGIHRAPLLHSHALVCSHNPSPHIWHYCNQHQQLGELNVFWRKCVLWSKIERLRWLSSPRGVVIQQCCKQRRGVSHYEPQAAFFMSFWLLWFLNFSDLCVIWALKLLPQSVFMCCEKLLAFTSFQPNVFWSFLADIGGGGCNIQARHIYSQFHYFESCIYTTLYSLQVSNPCSL